ncbi:MAG TPA: TIGR03885 family FMN-dependent LLM class oxidoreductase [Dehalococcoidia bacterium]|nr:TIGR03885 family FMN-dependent LLM class oxidoreductase [Dehalococcoidia bacterium]
MPPIGYHASHEQFAPSDLLTWVQTAAQAGFTAAMCSDHFAPWSEQQGESGFAWSWLGAAMQCTVLPFGVVNAPGWRYHPAIIAQAAATLAEMFPGRFWMAVGTGQALSEHITGLVWPDKDERNAHLKECVDVIRALWAGETVRHRGRIQVHDAKLYTRPARPPALIGAALTPQTAEWVGGWADGLITINQAGDQVRQVLDAFRRGGGEGKPRYLQVHLSYARTEEEALQNAWEQWRTNVFASSLAEELEMPEQFEAAARFVRPEDLTGHVRVSADVEQHLRWLREDLELGFDAIYLHNVGRNQPEFIEVFGKQVVPQLTRA